MVKKLYNMKPIKDKSYLLFLFDNAIEQATQTAILRNQPIPTSKRDTYVGNYLVRKNNNNLYDIKDGIEVLYENLYMYEAAISIAQRQNQGFDNSIKEIIKIDDDYGKHRNDMMVYLNCYKAAKQRKDIERMSILEDKFYMSEQLSKLVKQRIRRFKVIR